MIRVACLTIALAAALNAAEYRDLNKTVSLKTNGTLTIENHKGLIHVTTWDRAEVEIKARIEAEPGTAMDRRRFEETEVLIDSSADAVHVRTRYPDFNWCCFNDDGNNPEVRYTIQMPRTARLEIHDHRSTTEISDLHGALQINTHRGTVRVERLTGPIDLTTHRGDIRIEFAAFSGNSSIDNYRGEVELLMPRNSRFDVQADLGRHANIETDFALMSRSMSGRSGSVHGAVNGGGPTLRLAAYRGDIRLRAR